MTPKEKAIELYNKFYPNMSHPFNVDVRRKDAKQCALIAVEELELISDLKTSLEDRAKSPSQRLRAVLYLLWKKDSKGYSDFELFYAGMMEKIVSHYKNLL
jgi:hypothetical protein